MEGIGQLCVHFVYILLYFLYTFCTGTGGSWSSLCTGTLGEIRQVCVKVQENAGILLCAIQVVVVVVVVVVVGVVVGVLPICLHICARMCPSLLTFCTFCLRYVAFWRSGLSRTWSTCFLAISCISCCSFCPFPLLFLVFFSRWSRFFFFLALVVFLVFLTFLVFVNFSSFLLSPLFSYVYCFNPPPQTFPA